MVITLREHKSLATMNKHYLAIILALLEIEDNTAYVSLRLMC